MKINIQGKVKQRTICVTVEPVNHKAISGTRAFPVAFEIQLLRSVDPISIWWLTVFTTKSNVLNVLKSKIKYTEPIRTFPSIFVLYRATAVVFSHQTYVSVFYSFPRIVTHSMTPMGKLYIGQQTGTIKCKRSKRHLNFKWIGENHISIENQTISSYSFHWNMSPISLFFECECVDIVEKEQYTRFVFDSSSRIGSVKFKAVILFPTKFERIEIHYEFDVTSRICAFLPLKLVICLH